jgi:hypothetical protein
VERQEIIGMHWDVSKLLELGVSEEFVSMLSPSAARDLVKGLLYLKERFGHGQEF